MRIKPFPYLLLILSAFIGCNSQSAGIKDLNADEFEKAIKAADVQLVDVRTPEEFESKHIAGAKNINIDDKDFESGMNRLDKSKPVYIYCLAGTRSKKAANWAGANGFHNVYNLEHGINSWLASNKPVQTANGQPVKGGMSFDDYLTHIKQSDKLVLVDFNATWCGPCKIIKPAVQKTIKDNAAKVNLFDIDVDQNPIIAKTMNITGIPLLILYKQGKEVWRNLGLIDEKDIQMKVKEFAY